MPERAYAQTSSTTLTGDHPIDFARVLTILDHATTARDARRLGDAFTGAPGRSLKDVVHEAVQQGRLDYLDHVFAEPSERHSAWAPDNERVPAESGDGSNTPAP